MTTITLPPEIERQLVREARRRGTTPELLALDSLRRLFIPDDSCGDRFTAETLSDFLVDDIGTVNGTSEPLSEDCGRRYLSGLIEKDDRRAL